MIRRYCDLCEQEVKPDEIEAVQHRPTLYLDGVMVQLMVATEGTWNRGHLHLECAKRVVAEGALSPKSGPHPIKALFLKRELGSGVPLDQDELRRRQRAAGRDQDDP